MRWPGCIQLKVNESSCQGPANPHPAASTVASEHMICPPWVAVATRAARCIRVSTQLRMVGRPKRHFAMCWSGVDASVKVRSMNEARRRCVNLARRVAVNVEAGVIAVLAAFSWATLFHLIPREPGLLVPAVSALGLLGGVLVVQLGHAHRRRWAVGAGHYMMAAAALGFGVAASIWIDDTPTAIVARMASCGAVAILPIVTFHGSDAITGKQRRLRRGTGPRPGVAAS